MPAVVANQINLNVQPRALEAPPHLVQNAGRQFPVAQIKKISIFTKVISCIPFLGIFPSLTAESQLEQRVNLIDIDDLEGKIKMLKTQKNFFKHGRFRSFLEMALIAAHVAIGIIVSNTSIVPILVFGGLMFLGVASMFEITRYQIRESSKKIARYNEMLLERQNRQMVQNG